VPSARTEQVADAEVLERLEREGALVEDRCQPDEGGCEVRQVRIDWRQISKEPMLSNGVLT
jgi:hypothetical protein